MAMDSKYTSPSPKMVLYKLPNHATDKPITTGTSIPKDFLHSDLFVFDVIYNPLETMLLKDAADIGCKTLGGLDMLVNQGVLAFEWWTGKQPNSVLMKSKIIEFLGIK